MPSLIISPVPGKKRPRTCNSQCHYAKHPTCCCVCGGVNHQVGLEKAIENTRILMGVILEANSSVRFSKVVQQLKLKEET